MARKKVTKISVNFRLRNDLALSLKRQSENIGDTQVSILEEVLDRCLDNIVIERRDKRREKLNSVSNSAKLQAKGKELVRNVHAKTEKNRPKKGQKS